MMAPFTGHVKTSGAGATEGAGASETAGAAEAAGGASEAGDAVSTGSVIGSVGQTAAAESGRASHLHYALLKDGYAVDPAEYLPEQ